MDRLDAMTTLLAVVDAGSLSAASRKLGTPLATVSRRVSELEAHLNTRLLNRSSRSLTLTDSGEVYIQACRRILDQLDEAEHIASGEYRAPKGEPHCQINVRRAEGAPGGIRDQAAAATASCHWFAASARKIRSVERETRWR